MIGQRRFTIDALLLVYDDDYGLAAADSSRAQPLTASSGHRRPRRPRLRPHLRTEPLMQSGGVCGLRAQKHTGVDFVRC